MDAIIDFIGRNWLNCVVVVMVGVSMARTWNVKGTLKNTEDIAALRKEIHRINESNKKNR